PSHTLSLHDALPIFLPERAARRLCVRRPDPSPRRAAPGAAPCRAARAIARLPADPRLERLEAAGRRAADRAHPAAFAGHHRPALLPAVDDDAAPAGVVLAPLPMATQLQWLALAAMGSVMLLAVTNHITQNVASVPFLWVLPLALYLGSFILAFDHPRWYVRPLFIVVLVALLPAMAFYVPSLKLPVALPLYLIALFASCMFCHAELARLNPDPLPLTPYYLMISLGGALGAVLVAVLAPLTLP